MCKQESSSDKSTKIYTRKELLMTETTIYDFHTRFYSGRHIYAKAYDMENDTMCKYPQSVHTGNVYYGAVPNVYVSIFPTKK